MNSLTKLLETPLPINRDAAKVVRKASKDDVWMPSIVVLDHTQHSPNVLPTKTPPPNADTSVIGKRRDRMVVVGYAASQPKGKYKNARWVVRCDCGNYEHRTKIFRWLGTDCVDMCLECRKRTYLTKGDFSPREAVPRATKPL